MKNLAWRSIIAVIMLCSVTVSGQIVGFNGTNSPENLTPEVRGYLVELTVDTLGFVFRDDKYVGARAPSAEISNVIALSNELRDAGKVLEVCFTVYTRTGINVSNAMADLDAFRNAGVLIYSVRLGNEEWASTAGGGKKRTFAQYWEFCQPYISELQARGITKILIPLARPGDGLPWNTDGAAKIMSADMYKPDWHLYWGPKQANVLDTLDNKQTTTVVEEDLPKGNPSQDLNYHRWFYNTLYQQVLNYDLLSEVAEWSSINIPGKEWHITEFGPPTAVGHISNVIAFDALTDWLLNRLEFYPVRFVARFNGPSPTGTACISPVNPKFELTSAGKAYNKRLSYWTTRNYLLHRGALKTPVINSQGVSVVNYHNVLGDAREISDILQVDRNLIITDAWWEGCSGSEVYSGSGVVSWWATGSPKVYDVTLSTADYVPAHSYGYIVVSTRTAIYGCMDASALNYNPDADMNDGSCYYFSDCGCWDVTASNYNPDSPCQDNSKCEYPVKQCYKKRWLFQSMPCKPSKTNCNCE